MSIVRPKARRREMLEFSLNITSLMDVLTVLLFFLLKSFSVSATVLSTPEGVRLPVSDVKAKIEDTVTMVLTPDAVKVNGETLMKLSGGRFLASDLGPDQRTLTPLKRFLDEQFTKRNLLFDATVDRSELPPGRLMIQADKEVPFATMKYLLHTASSAGYSDYEFVVTNPDEG